MFELKRVATLGLWIAVPLFGCVGCDGGHVEPAGLCAPGATLACVGPAGCEGVQVCDASGDAYGSCECESPATDATVPPDQDGGVAAADAGSPPDGSVAWSDPALSTDPADIAAAASYEDQIWEHRGGLRALLIDAFGVYRQPDSEAGEYSSGWGIAAYHTMDEAIALAFVMETTRDEARRDHYAALAYDFLEIVVPAVAEARGTVEAGCPVTAMSVYYCSQGYFRYLDAGHGAGGAGHLMNALYENPRLRERYADDLTRWMELLVPTLERHYAITEPTEISTFPHMPSKIAPAYIAAWKILGETRYRDAFVRVATVLQRSVEADNPIVGWPGSDASPAGVSVAMMNLVFREQLRGTIPETLRVDHLRTSGETYSEALPHWSFTGDDILTGSLVSLHGVNVGVSPAMAARVDPTYDLSGDHGWAVGLHFHTVAAIAMGHAMARP